MRVSPANAMQASELFADLYHHAVPFSREALAKLWRSCEADPKQREACDAAAHAREGMDGGDGGDRAGFKLDSRDVREVAPRVRFQAARARDRACARAAALRSTSGGSPKSDPPAAVRPGALREAPARESRLERRTIERQVAIRNRQVAQHGQQQRKQADHGPRSPSFRFRFMRAVTQACCCFGILLAALATASRGPARERHGMVVELGEQLARLRGAGGRLHMLAAIAGDTVVQPPQPMDVVQSVAAETTGSGDCRACCCARAIPVYSTIQRAISGAHCGVPCRQVSSTMLTAVELR